jgi:hypothetical protein
MTHELLLSWLIPEKTSNFHCSRPIREQGMCQREGLHEDVENCRFTCGELS